MAICILKSHEDVIGAYEDAGRPLDSDAVDAIEAVAIQLEMFGEEDTWLVFEGKCQICNYMETTICPACNDIDNQECHNCGNDTMQVREIPEWEQDV